MQSVHVFQARRIEQILFLHPFFPLPVCVVRGVEPVHPQRNLVFGLPPIPYSMSLCVQNDLLVSAACVEHSAGVSGTNSTQL